MMKVKITCKEATLLVVKNEDKQLSAWQRLQLFMHLLYCTFCKRFSKQNRILSKAVSHQPTDVTLTEAEKTKLKESLKP